MSLNESVFFSTVFVLGTQIMLFPKSVYLCHNWPEMSHPSNEIMCAMWFAHATKMCFYYCTEYAIQENGYKEIGSSKEAEIAS